MTDETKELRRRLTTKRRHRNEEPKVVPKHQLLSTGSTLLNLAISGEVSGGFVMGKYHFLVGDSSSGKTWLSLTCLAEAARSKRFNDFRFIYDNVEDGALMDFDYYFGSKVAERVEPPAVDADGEPVHSSTIEEFYFHLDDARKDGRPMIYVLDSMDSLSTTYEGAKFDEKKTANRKGTKAKGDYGDGKAKANSAGLRRILPFIRKTGSILIIIAQTRDNVNAGLFEPTKTRSGGHALKFYAVCELWTSVGSAIKKTVNDRARKMGINCNIVVKKNRVTGKDRMVTVPLYNSFGIDDIGACVDYLVLEKHWSKKTGGKINAVELELCATKERLIKEIEEHGLERQLRVVVGRVWREVEDKLVIERKRRYE